VGRHASRNRAIAAARLGKLWAAFCADGNDQALIDPFAIERADVLGINACVDSARRIHRELCAQALTIGSGVAAFAGVESPLSQAVGLGMGVAISDNDMERVTAFYEERDTTPRVLVNPNADLSLPRALARAGYVPAEYENALGADLAQVRGARDVRIVEASDRIAWGILSAKGFLGTDDVPEGASTVGEIVGCAEGVIALECREDGVVAATGAMAVQGELAGFFASSVLPPFRGRGWQTALILDRLARARESGARFGRASAAVGSASERNFLKCGFCVLYTRTMWERARSKRA
jgi:hypothetical protein